MKKLKTITKIILIILVLTSMLFILAGCTVESSAETEERFIKIYREGNLKLYYDNETKVQYILVSNGYGTAMTVLLDAEGKPLLYEEK